MYYVHIKLTLSLLYNKPPCALVEINDITKRSVDVLSHSGVFHAQVVLLRCPIIGVG